ALLPPSRRTGAGLSFRCAHGLPGRDSTLGTSTSPARPKSRQGSRRREERDSQGGGEAGRSENSEILSLFSPPPPPRLPVNLSRRSRRGRWRLPFQDREAGRRKREEELSDF